MLFGVALFSPQGTADNSPGLQPGEFGQRDTPSPVRATYREGEKFIVMDLETFDQIPVSADVVGDMAKWLKPNEQVTCELFNGEMVSFNIPFTVALEVVDAPPVVKGATATNQLKEVVLETGAKVRVPPFIDAGTRINVDTRTGEYIDRTK